MADETGQLRATRELLGGLAQQGLADLPRPRPPERRATSVAVEDEARELLLTRGRPPVFAPQADLIESAEHDLKLRDDLAPLRADDGDPVDVSGCSAVAGATFLSRASPASLKPTCLSAPSTARWQKNALQFQPAGKALRQAEHCVQWCDLACRLVEC